MNDDQSPNNSDVIPVSIGNFSFDSERDISRQDATSLFQLGNIEQEASNPHFVSQIDNSLYSNHLHDEIASDATFSYRPSKMIRKDDDQNA